MQKKTLARKREQADIKFSSLLYEIEDVARELGTEIKIPRLARRQMHRENHEANNKEEYFRRSVYIPLLEHVIVDLNNRFSDDTLDLYNLSILIPENFDKPDLENKIHILAKKYDCFFNNDINYFKTKLNNELEMWKDKWQNSPILENRSAIELLKNCNRTLYPLINILLKILITLPISVASAERSFSSLKRLKTWLRTNMSQDRLNGLALMNIHNDFIIDTENVIDKYAKRKNNRRLEFSL